MYIGTWRYFLLCKIHIHGSTLMCANSCVSHQSNDFNLCTTALLWNSWCNQYHCKKVKLFLQMSYKSSLAIRCYIRQAFAISSIYYALFSAVYWSPLYLIASITPVSKQLDPAYPCVHIVAHLSETLFFLGKLVLQLKEWMVMIL